jgi:hypothetical protein
VAFTDSEFKLMRQLGIAIFRDKLILDAQPPITETQLANVRTKVDGEIPPELIALWQSSFGGELDYDYEVIFGEHLYTASFRELFYPGSNRYHDLDGWIDVELELGQEAAEEQGKPIPQRTPFLPFGGFEYLERFYVSLQSDEYGAVLVYAQGIPWKGRLNEDSVANVAGSVSALFDQLSLNEDPFDKKSGEYASGKEMVERILEIEAEHPHLAEKLKQVVRRSIFDWQSIIERTNFKQELTSEESKALRLALQYAVDRSDVGLVDRLHKRGAHFDITLHGTGGILDCAMVKQAFSVVERLIELGVELGEAPILHATNCPDELLLRLIAHGATFDEEAIYSAAETGAIDGAIALVNSSQVVEQESVSQVISTATERAARHDEDATKVETGQLGSYLTADDYRKQATLLREFARRLANGI